MTDSSRPTLEDIQAAREAVYAHLKPTPLYHYPGLSRLVGTEVWVKHENHLPTGAFKVRGGLNLAAHLRKAGEDSGIYTASTGNHGQSIAYAARAYGLQATVAVPRGANPGKLAAIRDLGAEIRVHGRDFDQAREWVMELAEREGGRFVGPTEELLICGVGTYALEILGALPEVDTIIVPVGGGSGASATAIVAKSTRPAIEIIGVQSAQAPAMQKSWRARRMVPAPMNTFAEGLATRVPFENTQAIMGRYLDDFILVDDNELATAIIHLLEHTHNLAEGAGAAALAGALNLKKNLKGKKVVLILSGGNLSLDRLKTILLNQGKQVYN